MYEAANLLVEVNLLPFQPGRTLNRGSRFTLSGLSDTKSQYA